MSTCHVVELDLAGDDFPDRISWLALLSRLPELGTLRCVEVALRPAGGGRLSFVVLDSTPGVDTLRRGIASLVGENAILNCTSRPA